MKFKNTIILLILLIALVVVALIIENPFSNKAQKMLEEQVTILFPSFKIEEAAKIEIKQLGSEFVLEQKGGKWVVSSDKDFPADQESVEKLLESVRDFKVQDVVSKNKEKQNLFQVNDMMGIGAKISNSKGNVIAHIYVGKNGPNFLSTYIRKEGSDEVILSGGYLKSIFDRSRTGWKDMNIFKFDTKLCNQIYLESPEGKILCEKDDKGTWNVKEPEIFPADQQTVDKIVETLSGLTTNDYPEKKDLSEYGLDKPVRTLKFSLTDKSEHTLLISKEDKNKFYAQKPDSDLIYSLYKYRIDNIFKKLDDFRKKVPEEAEAQENA
ncbi:DUF4340 domain-containing protein, partial [bacterium]|nr:DUF4340 domain-containing protein [bacterium]